MIKHIGRHGDRKIVILYRTVPSEEHMCLVSYSDALPTPYHDAVMRVLESAAGQQAQELADALYRNLLPDGRNVLHTLHGEGLIKKVPTNQVIVTPDSKSNVRLDELNDILSKMNQGQDAVRRMAEIDAQAGLKDPAKNKNIPKHLQESEAMSDGNLANNLNAQAARMRTEAQTLLAEAARLESEAQNLTPVAAKKTARKERVKPVAAKKTRIASK